MKNQTTQMYIVLFNSNDGWIDNLGHVENNFQSLEIAESVIPELCDIFECQESDFKIIQH